MDERLLIQWFRNLYRARSNGTDILDADPRYRVTWTEIWAKMRELGYVGNGVDGRLEWDRIRRKIKV